MLYNVLSILNLLYLLVVHTIVVEMNTYPSERNFKNVNEYPFCADVFDIKQCHYIKHVLTTFVNLYEMKKSNEDQSCAICKKEIRNMLEEIEIIKHQLNTFSVVTTKMMRNNESRDHAKRKNRPETSHRNHIDVQSNHSHKSWNPLYNFFEYENAFKRKMKSRNRYVTRKKVFSFTTTLC